MMWRLVSVLCLFLAPSLGQDGGGGVFEGSRVMEAPFFWSASGGSMMALPPRGGGAGEGGGVFPRKRPDAGNVDELCADVGRDPPPAETLPRSGHLFSPRSGHLSGHQQRLANAQRVMDAAINACCRDPHAHGRLPCALHAWKQSLRDFCEDELSVKSRTHECCLQQGIRRWYCFAWAAHSHSYTPPLQAGTTEERAVTPVEVELPFPGTWTEEEISALPPVAADTGRDLSIGFPRQRPDAGNVDDLCRYAGRRESAPAGTLLPAGFSHLRRLVGALTAMEDAFTVCCGDTHAHSRLPCTLLAWERTLDELCMEGPVIHRCCLMPGDKTHECFSWAAPPLSYFPPAHGRAEVLDFTDTDFPPGRPTEGNIGNICRARLRQSMTFVPVAQLVELTPGQLTGARLLVQLSGQYQACCGQDNPLECARNKWTEVLTHFCMVPVEAGGAFNPCCLNTGKERDACFASQASNPNYDREVHTLNLAAVTAHDMNILCGSPFEVSNGGPQRLLVKVLQRCCEEESTQSRLDCGVNKRAVFVDRACNRFSSKWNDTLDCCSLDSETCFNNNYLAQVKIYIQTA